MKYRLFSEREARKRAEFPPQQASRTFTQQLRRNLVTIILETFGRFYDGYIAPGNRPVETTALWIEFERLLLRESEEYANSVDKRKSWKADRYISEFIMSAPDPDVLDVLDLAVALIHQRVGPFQQRWREHLDRWAVLLSAETALQEIDLRLREAGTVYRIADGQVIISTDDYSHNEIIRPALQALREAGFENAAAEFHEALGAFRTGAFDIVLTKANHAFESTMKVIAGKLRWQYDQSFTAKKMLDVMFTNGLLPVMRDSAMKSLATMLESDLPTLRNKMPSAGHGSGEQRATISEPIAVYALNVAAANIRLLVESYKLQLKGKG